MPPKLAPLIVIAGKGGVGRTTIAAALGTAFARQGERVLVVQWAVPDALSGWYGLPEAGHEAQELRPGLWTMNYSCAETLREYFVGHLGLQRLHRYVVASEPIQRLVHTVPGVQELLFLGRLFWLKDLAFEEVGVKWDRLIVDAPATGHGVSLFGVPAAVEALGAGGLLQFELGRVEKMLGDPRQVGVMAVTLPQELPVEETRELLVGVEEKLHRPALAAIVNRSAAPLARRPMAEWLGELTQGAQADDVPALQAAAGELEGRLGRERAFRAEAGPQLPLGTWSVDERLLLEDDPRPKAIVDSAADQLAPWIGAMTGAAS